MPLLTPHVPSGLIDLMKDLAKEVLREKPENIYEFAVVHFEKLILERDGSLDKGYEEFSAFEAYFDGEQRFAVPTNHGYICQKPIKIQPIAQPKKSKSDIMASFQAMESINEEDVLAPPTAPQAANPSADNVVVVVDEKYQNAIYVIQRYFRRYMARKKNPPNTITKAKSLSAFTAAIIIQRTMRRLFSNKIKLKKDKDSSGPSLANAVKLVPDDMDNVSEAASYTSSSTIQMLADGQEGRENRLASGQSRRQREEVSDGGYVDGDGDGGGVVGAAVEFGSMEFKEPTQDEEPPSTSSSATATAVVADDDDDEEHSHSHSVVADVAVKEMDRKSIADENGNNTTNPEEEKPHLTSASTTDDTSTAHNIGILSTKIGSNYNHQNLPNTNNNIQIDRNRKELTHQINATQLNIVPAGLSVPLNNTQSPLLGATPDNLPATSPYLKETQVHHHLEEYANENSKNHDASSLYEVDGRIRKFDSGDGESLKIYDVYYHDMNDQEFSDSLNESIMEKDSLEPEELDADSLESNENVVHHMSDIVKRDIKQDDGSLYGDKNDDEEGDGEKEAEAEAETDLGSNDDAQNVQKFIEVERVPTYLYGIHPARTPVVERRNRNRNSEEVHTVPDGKNKYLEAAAVSELESRSPDEKSEEESLESKASTSEESSATQIENDLELRALQNKTSRLKVELVKDDEKPTTTDKLFNDEHSNSSIAEGQLIHKNETKHPTTQIESFTLDNNLKTKEDTQNDMSSTINLKSNNSLLSTEKLTDFKGEDSTNLNETNLLENSSKNPDSKVNEENNKNGKTNEKANDINSSKLKENYALEENTTNLVEDSNKQINKLEKTLMDNDLGKSAFEKLNNSEQIVPTENDNLNSIPENISLLADKGITIEKSQTENQNEVISSKIDQAECDVKNSEDELQKLLTSKKDDNNTSPIVSKTFDDHGKTEVLGEKISLDKDTHLPVVDGQNYKRVDRSEDLVYDEGSVKQKSLVSDTSALIEENTKINTSDENLFEEVQNKKDSSPNLSKADLGGTLNIPENLKSETNEIEKKQHLDHDQEIESQLQELQKLNTLHSNTVTDLNIEDIKPDSQVRNKRSVDKYDHKISQHDGNNSLEDLTYQSKDILPEEPKNSDKPIEANSKSSEYFQAEQKNVFPKSKSEVVVEKSLKNLEGVPNEEEEKEVKIVASDADFLKNIDDHIVKNSAELPSTSDKVTKLFTNEEVVDNSDIKQSNDKTDKSLLFDHKDPEKQKDGFKEEAKIINLKEKHFLKNDNEDKLDEEVRTNNEDTQDKFGKVLDKDTIATLSISEDKAVEKLKDKIQVENNGSDNRCEDKDETIKLVDSEKLHTAQKSSTPHDEHKINEDKSNESSKKYPAENLKTKEISTESLDSTVSEKKEDLENTTSKTADSQDIKILESIKSTQLKEEQSSMNSQTTRSSEPFEETSSENIISENIQDSNQSMKVVDVSSKTVESEDLKEAKHDNDLQNILLSDNTENINLIICGEEPGGLPNQKLDEEALLKMHTVEEKKLADEKLSSETHRAESSSKNAKSDQESKTIQEDEIANGSEKKIQFVSERPPEDVVGLNENISAKHSASKKADHEHSIATTSTNIEGCSNSADTSNDFSSIGKDLEFFEDTIKYLKNATEHLGGMKEVFDAKTNSMDVSKDANNFNDSAVLIQSAFRGYQVRKSLKELRNKRQNESETTTSENKPSLDNKKTKSEPNDANEVSATIKIQSAYRGYRVRKDLKSKINNEETVSQQSISSSDSNDQINAAIKIQSAYRGHRIRKDLRNNLNQEQTVSQQQGNASASPKEDKTYIHSSSKNSLGSNQAKSQIPVAVIHPTKYLSSMEEAQPEKVLEANASISKPLSSFERNETAGSSPSKQTKSSKTTPIKANNKHLKTSPQKTSISTRQKPLEKKSHVKNDSSDELKEESSITHKRSIEKNDQTFIRDTLDQTVKMDQTQILGNRKLAKTNSLGGYGNKSKNFNTKTLSTADLLERSKGTKNIRNQFERKGKSVSTNGRTQNQESFDIETIKKELLSTTFKSPPQSGTKKKTGTRVKSGKRKNSGKHSKGTRIPQKSPSKINNTKQTKQDELQSVANTELEKPVSIDEESDLSKTITLEIDRDKNVDLSLDTDREESNNIAKKPTLNKTFTVRSSLNEFENLDSQLETYEKKREHSSEGLLDSLKKDVEKLKTNVQEKAAVTIQKTFRGFRTRKNLNRGSESNPIETFDNSDLRIASGTPKNAFEDSSNKVEKTSSENQEKTTENINPNEIKKVEGDIAVAETEKDSSMQIENLQDSALDKAATAIQKTYRGYRTRKSNKSFDKKGERGDINQDTAEEKITNNLEVQPEKVFNEKMLKSSNKINSEESTNLEKSAITIQKTFRGYQSRKKLKSKKISKPYENKDEEKDPNLIKGDETPNTQTDTVNLDLKPNDEQSEETSGFFEDVQKSFEGYKNLVLHNSATTIQKHFRGYKIRKDMNTNGVKIGTAKDTPSDKKVQATEELNEAIEKSSVHEYEVEKRDTKEEEGKQDSRMNDLDKSETEPILTEGKIKEKDTIVGQTMSTALDKSATTIQKHFRGYKVRKDMNTKSVRSGIAKDMKAHEEKGKKIVQEHVLETLEIKEGPEKQESVLSDFIKPVLKEETGSTLTESELKEESKTVGQCSSPDLEKSATTIQKHFRGYKVRKNKTTKVVRFEIAKDVKTQRNQARDEEKEKSVVHEDVEEKSEIKEKNSKQDPGINDYNKLVLNKETGSTLTESESKAKSKTPGQCSSPDLEKSATIIQKNFRGYKTRQNLKKASNGRIDNATGKSKSHTDSFDEEKEFHHEALQKSATTIQKTFRGYKTRKDLQSKKNFRKPMEDSPKIGETEGKIFNPMFDENLIQEQTKDHDQTDNLNKQSIKATEVIHTGVEENLERTKEARDQHGVQQAGEDHASTSKKSPNQSRATSPVASSDDGFKSISLDSITKKEATKSSSAGAVLENAASIIQKAYRDFHSKNNNLPTKSYSNGTHHRESIPKEALENSDESSTFIGPDTSFDLSDVESVETKSEKVFLNYDQTNSSETHTPTNNSEEAIVPTLSINGVHFEDQEIDNECVSSPEKLRLKRNIIEPTAPPLGEIHKVEEPISVSPKLKWYLGDDPIIPSDSSSSSKSSSPVSSSVDPLVSTSSKLNNLSSIDACRENLNSNQQLTPSISSAVVSTSSLLLTNNTEINDKNTLNKNSGIVSAINEEENLKKDESNLEQMHQSEETTIKLKNEEEMALSNVKSNDKLSNDSKSKDTESKPKEESEDEPDDIKKSSTDLCKNCAEGIHEGGICSEDLIKTTKSDKTEFDPSDQIKQFVLMEDLNHAHSTGGNIQSSVVSSQKEKTFSNDPSVEASNVIVTVSDLNSQVSKNEVPTEQLASSNYCPAISLIPPSSEDDASERESSIEVKTKNVDNGLKNETTDDEKSGDIAKIGMKTNEGTGDSFEKSKEIEKVETEANTNCLDTDTAKQTNLKTGEDISKQSINKDLLVDSKENTSTKEADKEVTETMQVSKEEETKNSSIDTKSSSDEIEENEDAFKMRPGENIKIGQNGFEDDFSNSKDIEVASEAIQVSTELKEKTQLMEESKQDIKKEELIVTKEKEATSTDFENEKVKPFEESNIVIGANLSEAKVLESETTKEVDSHESMEEIQKSSKQKIIEETATRNESLESKIENISSPPIELSAQQNGSQEITELEVSTTCDTGKGIDNADEKIDPKDFQQNDKIKKETQDNQKGETEIKQTIKDPQHVSSSLDDDNSAKIGDGIVESEISKEMVKSTNNAIETKISEEDEKDLERHEDATTSTIRRDRENGQLQEDIEIAAKLIESSLSDPQAQLLENENKDKLANKECEDKNESESQVEAKIEKLIEDNLKPVEDPKNTVDSKDLPTADASEEVIEEPCVKKVIPPTPFSAGSSDPEESELESTTTKAESTTTTPGCDETSETDALDIPPSKPDALDAMTEKLREPEKMVARMRQRRASEHKISIDSVTDQQAVFEEPICEPIKPMQKIQKSSSTEAEDECVLQELQRGDTTRESSAQSESVVYGDSTSQLTESEDTFNENLDHHPLHRMNTIAANRSTNTFKPQSHLFKSVTIDDTVKYIDPEKSTEESGSSFCMDDALSEDVRKKMMAYSISEADSDYYDVGDQTNHPHDDFNISTALDNFPSTDTDTTIVSAATKIQAGARGFLTRRRIRRASMGTKASLTEERKLSFGDDAIGESLDQLAEEENGRRQFNRQTGVNSLPSALEHSDEMLSPLGEDIQIATVTPSKHSLIKIEDKQSNKVANDVNDWLENSKDDSSQIVSNLDSTVARRLTLQRGDALRNDSTPDDENGNGKQVDLAKNNSSSMGAVLVHEKTMVESTTTTTTRTTTERRNYSDAAVSNKKDKIKWFALRQNSMPVQIDSEIFRVLPKHMRKRIKSAEGEKPKRIRLPRD